MDTKHVRLVPPPLVLWDLGKEYDKRLRGRGRGRHLSIYPPTIDGGFYEVAWELDEQESQVTRQRAEHRDLATAFDLLVKRLRELVGE